MIRYIFVIFISLFLTHPSLSFAQSNNEEQIVKRQAKARQQHESKNYAGALVEYLEIIKLGGDPAFLYNIAVCYRLIGDLYNAQKYFEEYKREDAAAQFVFEADEQLKLIEKEMKSGKGKLTPNQKNARKYQDKATKSYSEALAVVEKDIDKAHSLFDESAKNYILSYNLEADTWKLYNIAQAYRLAGNEPDATAYYKKYIELANKNEKYAETKERIASSKKHLATLDSISQDNFDRLPDIPLPDLPAPLPETPRRKWPFVVAGVGAALLASGAVVFFITQ
jgi:tetratricopeptide (TPR) repeat protein